MTSNRFFRNIPRVAGLTILSVFTFFTTEAQDMASLRLSPIQAWGNADMGGAGYRGELRTHLKDFGLKLDYGKGYTKESDSLHYYKYFDEFRAQVSWRFSKKKSDGKIVGRSISLGYTQTNAYKNQLFQAVDPTLRPPESNPDESQRLLSEYFTNLKVSSGYFSLGYERLKKNNFHFAGYVTRVLLDPFGFVIGKVTTFEQGEVFYTSTLFFDLLFLAPGGASYSPREYFTIDKKRPAPNTPLVMETMYQNKVGFRMGYELATLTAFGLSFGLEAGMMPGIYNYNSDYGRGFPQDNIYFSAKAGVALGYAPKKDI